MKVYWYWPYLRREELGLAEGVIEPGDHLVVHTTPRPSDPIVSPDPAWEVRATLPAVADRSEGTASWVASRATTYALRVRDRRAAIRGGGFDVGHIVYLNPFTDAFDLRTLGRKLPLVSTVHDVVPHNTRLNKAVEHRMLAVQYRNAGTLLVHHESVGRRLTDEFAVDPERIVVIPLQIPEVEPPTRTEDGPPLVLFFGTFRRNKGVHVLLDAIERLRGETDARFLFAGRGFPDVERLVTDAAARDPRIETEIGYATADRKNELHALADLMVLPYTSFASQSAVIQDAYAHRLPVVVSDVGALGETVREDHTGWVVPPADPEHLATTILEALRDAPARAAASAAADGIARARTPELTGHRLRETYTHVLASFTHGMRG